MKFLFITGLLLLNSTLFGQNYIEATTNTIGSTDSSIAKFIKMNLDEIWIITKMDSNTTVTFRPLEKGEHDMITIGGVGDSQVKMTTNYNNSTMLVNLPIYLIRKRYVIFVETPVGRCVEIDVIDQGEL